MSADTNAVWYLASFPTALWHGGVDEPRYQCCLLYKLTCNKRPRKARRPTDRGCCLSLADAPQGREALRTFRRRQPTPAAAANER